MYKLLIVDDEELIRRGLKYAIKWETMGFTVTAEASDGDDALHKLEKNHFDVILTDIRMPGMDGLTLIKTIKDRYPSIKVIIISGYSDFEYAVSALKMKVEDYILKPVKKENIETIFKILKGRLDREITDEKKFKTGEKAAKEYVLTRLINNNLHGREELYELLNKYEILLDEIEYCIIVLKIENVDYLVKKLFDNNHIAFLNALESTLDPFLSTSMSNKYITLVPYKEKDTAIENIICYLKSLPNCEYRIGVGSKYNQLDYMSISYSEAIETLKRCKLNNILPYSDMLKENNENITKRTVIQKRINDSMESGHFEELQQLISELFSDFIKYDIDTAYNWCVNSIYDLIKYFSIQEIQDLKIYYRLDIADIVASSDFEAVKSMYTENLQKIENILKQVAGESILKIINKAREIAGKEYSDKELSLSSLAGKLNISYGYLCTAFKQVTGENFTSYLTSIRMANARRLIIDGSYKIYEIADMIGYGSARYFTDTFKKHFGVSPSDYKTRLGGN